MKESQATKGLFCITFVVVLLAIFLLVLNSETEKAIKHFEKTSDVSWDGAEEYPFLEDNFDSQTDDYSSDIGAKFSAFIDKAQLFVKTGATSQFNLQMPFVVLTKFVDKFIWNYSLTTSLNGTDKEDNSSEGIGIVADSGNDSLYLIVADKSIDENIECLVEFTKDMKAGGRNFLFLEIPVNAYGENRLEKYPEYYQDFSTKYTDILITSLDAYNIPYVSMSNDFLNDGWTANEIFQLTDHHWRPQAALRACASLSEGLNQYCGYKIDPSIFDIENYTITQSSVEALGSLGNKLTNVYVKPESISIIVPDYFTDITAYISKKNETCTGEIEETLFDYSAINKTKSNFSQEDWINKWELYGYGDQALVSIHNNLVNDGRRLLILKNSFADAMVPYLSSIAEYVDIIQLDYFNGSLQSFISKTNPDTVVVAYTIRVFQGNIGTEGEFFNFN